MYARKAGNLMLLLLLGSILGLLALLAVHCIPLDRIQENVRQSLPMLQRDFLYGEAIEGYPASEIGSFTDCLMLEHAVYAPEEHSVLEQVLYMYRGESGQGEGWAPGYSLIDYLSGVEQAREVEYSRYWHGYLVVLKPLLYFMSFNALRMLASCLQLFLVGLILWLCFQRGEHFLGMSFLAALPFLYFFNLYLSLSLSICFYLMAVVVLVQLKWHEVLCRRQWYGEFFFLAGMATAYFDFLTYPLVTLGFPLCIFLYLSEYHWRESLKKLVVCSGAWGGGYAGIWAMKWVLVDFLAGGSTIGDGWNTILQRTSSVSGQSKGAGFLTVIVKNLGAYTNWAFYFVIFVIAAAAISFLVKNREFVRRNHPGGAGCILIVGMYPFFWYFLAQNHSEEHWVFTCKILAVTVFALLCAVGKLGKRCKGWNERCKK